MPVIDVTGIAIFTGGGLVIHQAQNASILNWQKNLLQKIHEHKLKKGYEMKNNVIDINRGAIPKDLISFKDFAEKYDMKKGYIYKLFATGKIKRYKRGVFKISESEVLSVLDEVI